MNKVVIFVTVSKREQVYQRQLEDLRALAKTQNLEIVAEITEKISEAIDNQERDGVQELLRLAQNGVINKVLVQEVSRLGRSTVEILKILEELTALKVSVYVQNFGFKTLKNGKRNPMAQFIFTLLAKFARMERETLRERILSGMDEARRQEKHLGRPDGSTENKEAFLKNILQLLEIYARELVFVRRLKFVIHPSIQYTK